MMAATSDGARKQMVEHKVIILLVEDDDGHAELVTRNLQRSGVNNEIVRFSNGYDVMEYLDTADDRHGSEIKYLMILDLNMPGMNGLQVLDRVKSSQRTKNIPIVVLTTADDAAGTEYCYEFGCNAFITKPVDYEAFSKAIQELGGFLKVARFEAARKDAQEHINY